MCDKFVFEIQKINVGYGKKLNVRGLMLTNRFIKINGKNKEASLVPNQKLKDTRFYKNTNLII